MYLFPRPRSLLLYGATLSLLGFGVFFLPGIGPALLRTNGYAPHGVCILWQPGLLWFHVTNDLLIGTSYVTIAVTLAYLVYRGRRDLPFHWVLLAFGAFIISCGSTHFMEAWTFWTPLYWLSGYTKLITAVASVATAVALPTLVPRILGLVDAARLSDERKHQLEAANAKLAQLNARLTELDELKSQMFANLSHELRTPLTLILGPAERLLAGASDSSRADLELIRRNAQLLQRHIDDLLDVARLEAGRFELRRASLDLSRLAERTADYFTGLAHDRGMRLSVDAPAPLAVQADADQLQRVLVNLLANAFKFTPDGGRVALSVRAVGPRAVVAVEDSGPGVPEAQRASIFERFRQGEGDSTRRFGGTGLGLAIAREIVALHGGTLTVDDSPLGGARFWIALPAGSSAAPVGEEPGRAATAERALAELRPPSIGVAAAVAAQGPADRPLALVVEDNPEMRQFIAGSLAAEYRVETAADGREGLDRAVALRPDVIISDMMMPVLSGDQLVAELRARPDLAATPIIVLTARANPVRRDELLRSGAQDYLLKPFSTSELLARLNNLVATARARRTLQAALDSQQHDVATLSAEVSRLYAEAQQALRLRDEFLAIAAHELRTPVTALLGNVQLLLRRGGRGEQEERRDLRALRAIEELVRRLAALIEMLLDVSRVGPEEFALTKEPLDLSALVRRQAELLRPSLSRHRLELRGAEVSLPVLSDALRLEQVLDNLLANAVKYSPGGGSIVVEVSRRAGHAEVAVSDEGIGIPAAALPQLFQRFYRAPNVDHRAISGFGVGLYLARTIVELHGGSISAESTEGQGSTFTIRLPLA